MIEDVLKEKQHQIISTGGSLPVKFVKSDIDTLIDIDELRIFKIHNKIPDDFKRCSTKDDCIRKILEGDSLYRVLEFCALTQPVLRKSINQVFKRWRY